MNFAIKHLTAMKFPKHLITLINILKRYPGVGNKTAERYAFQMLEWQPDHLNEMASAIQELQFKTKFCDECGCILDDDACLFCTDERINSGIICVIPTIREVYPIESTGEYRGLYHVLGGLLSPMEGIGPEKLKVNQLIERIAKNKTKEVVIGLDATLEGDATSLYLKKELANLDITISRLAFGIPMGSSLDYIDGGTLARAFMGRNQL
ncbi:MAG: recombination mediator RecR [Chlamydiota bacterium]|nr:recombination mediator RecR [Chlamydiota bacterium]